MMDGNKKLVPIERSGLTNEIIEIIEASGMTIKFNQIVNILTTIIAKKK
jgi:hypothetical protein